MASSGCTASNPAITDDLRFTARQQRSRVRRCAQATGRRVGYHAPIVTREMTHAPFAESADPAVRPPRCRRPVRQPPQRLPGRDQQQCRLPTGARSLPPEPGGKHSGTDHAALRGDRRLLPLPTSFPVQDRRYRGGTRRSQNARRPAEDRRLLRRSRGLLRHIGYRIAGPEPEEPSVHSAGWLPGLRRQGPLLSARNRVLQHRRRRRRPR